MFDDNNNDDKGNSIFDLFKNITKQDDEEKRKKLEQQMDDLNLEEWQKELVRKGEYEPEDFDEDDTSDEDNYYHDDD